MSDEQHVVYELLKDESGRVYAIGNSVECETKAEADKLVSEGTHKYKQTAKAKAPAKKKAKAGPKAEEQQGELKEDGTNN